jgi:hypothetical protein
MHIAEHITSGEVSARTYVTSEMFHSYSKFVNTGCIHLSTPHMNKDSWAVLCVTNTGSNLISFLFMQFSALTDQFISLAILTEYIYAVLFKYVVRTLLKLVVIKHLLANLFII